MFPLASRTGATDRRRSPAMRPRAALILAIMAIAALVAPAAVSAHAELDTVTPADKSTVQGSPDQIVMTFVENLDQAKSSIVVVDAGGAVVVRGGTFPSGKPREMDLALTTPLDPGTYTIRWTTTSSEDQETARGTTTFKVAAVASPSPTPTPAPSATAIATDASLPPTTAPTVASTPVASAAPTTPAASTSDVVIPIIAVVVAIAALGLWLLRGRSRARR